MAIDFAAIAARALAAADSLVPRWLPDGKREGHEWSARNPLRADHKAGSFKVNLVTGRWSDFATGDAGGDLIDLYAYVFGLKNGEAAKALADELGMAAPAERAAPPEPAPAEEAAEWRFIGDVTPLHPAPPQAHLKRGKPSARWAYRAQDGALMGFILRFETSDGGKEILPLTLWQHAATQALKWRWAAFPVPRPLYNLPALQSPGPVLLVEGEKACDAAIGLVPDGWACLTWPGGCKAVGKVDWSPLAGREVLLWPDHDAPGREAMAKIADTLAALGGTVAMIDVAAAFPEAGEGFDAADLGEAEDAPRRVAEAMTRHVIACAPPPAAPISTPPGPSGEGSGSGLFSKALIWGSNGLKDCRENVIYYLRDHPEWRGVLAVDEFANRIVFRKDGPLQGAVAGAEWSPNFDAELALWLAEREQAKLLVRSLDTIGHAVKYVAQLAKFHPVREYLDALVWDRQPRLDRWAVDFLGAADAEYTRLVGRYFLLNMVARIFEPGCIMRSVPVLEGGQNKGKSTALRILAQPWFSDTMFQVNNKDAYQAIQGMWLYEISELESFGRVEATAVKAFISSVEDNYRAPYERSNERHKRQTVFAGTTNAHEWLKDWTGNTRFWPLAVAVRAPIDLDGLRSARDQLMAEAVAMYRAGERRFPTQAMEDALFTPEQEARLILHPWVERVGDWLAMNMKQEVSVNELLMDCLKVDMARLNPTGTEAQTIGKVMAKLGWQKVRARSGNTRSTIYRKAAAAGEITATREPGSGEGANDVPF